MMQKMVLHYTSSDFNEVYFGWNYKEKPYSLEIVK